MAALFQWERQGAVSLFERIQSEGRRYSPTLQGQIREVVESVKTNLTNILNSHPGACQSAVELGVVDFNDAVSGTFDISEKIKETIKDCILRFEPRVSQVHITAKSNELEPLTLFFYVELQIMLDDIVTLTAFNIHLDNDRHYYLDLSTL
ncbi:hypothetical protein RO21_11775 [[Actinobacillus] muris]|uniref:IraD/Gp25-like domain-containing protein n=1 Tax=Muribacter muris TaxID=67855 RepID=A0A0J5P4S4_9PAST|nr:type VI secretion system baseplate subunit TssE [Muribacter muris]KMK50444.1 hypothetical protein RO21_11775 [[Actinobacillus] muris] [Muribacter muris]